MINAQKIHGNASKKEQEYLLGWQRARAELLNFKQRSHSQNEVTFQQAKRRILEPLLTVADSFQAVVDHVPKELEDNTWAKGVVYVARQLDQVLNEYGVVAFGEVGEVFDPKIHEAIDQVEGDTTESGKIATVVSKGYKMTDVLVRPAKVNVFS